MKCNREKFKINILFIPFVSINLKRLMSGLLPRGLRSKEGSKLMVQCSQHCMEWIEGIHANRRKYLDFPFGRFEFCQSRDDEVTRGKHFQELIVFFPRIKNDS